MTYLFLGLLVFLGSHSVRVFADDWRSSSIARLGAGPWKGMLSLVALGGFALIVWGFGLARTAPQILWLPPVWTRHLAGLLMVLSFVLLAAANVPGTHIKSWVGHPMVLGVKVWAAAHLIANGTRAHVVLFGAFLIWAIIDYAAARRRDRANGVSYPAVGFGRDAAAILLGVIAWAAFAFYAHAWLIGVSPFGVMGAVPA